MDTLTCVFWVIAVVAVIGIIVWFVKSKKKGKAEIETPSSFSTPEDKESEGE
ncbi:unnamed protein product [marine sediment metagenome]|uniref:Uncharacterized protein n=1 Tax=marine sediment metagenome TaxID=412755 RepID=X1P643_9ZZZZ